MASTIIVTAAAWFMLRPVIRRATGVQGSPAAGGGAAGLGAVLTAMTLVLAFTNPYAAALVLPAAHLWLAVTASETRLPPWLTLPAVAGGLALPALAVVVYGVTLDMGPLELAWLLFLAVAGGALGLGAAIAIALYAGGLVNLLVLLVARRRTIRELPGVSLTRGPGSYAGPGSLGGTRSASHR